MAGRPKRVFSEKEIEKIEQYARINCNTETIADGLNIPVTTLKRHYGRKLTHWRALGKLDMRKDLHDQRSTSPQTAIFIAKNELGMVDKQVVTTEQPKTNELTPAEDKAVQAAADAYKAAMARSEIKTVKRG